MQVRSVRLLSSGQERLLAEFEQRMSTDAPEKDWQAFFEANQWIFGHGLNYVSLDRASDTLTARTTGNEFDRSGKTADALMRTRAEVNQFVFVEIKKDTTDPLRRGDPYRPGCWGVSAEVSNAVTQVQKTTFEFARKPFRVTLKDSRGTDTGETAYSIEPRSFLIVGNTAELQGNDDKIECFELYRRNVRAPEILTFDNFSIAPGLSYKTSAAAQPSQLDAIEVAEAGDVRKNAREVMMIPHLRT